LYYRFVLDYEPDDFVLVYYRGSNDAWDGYGGAFLYTRSPSVRPELFPRLEKAVAGMGLKYQWSDFTLTDNTCKTLTESPTVLREKYATKLLITEEQVLQEQLTAARNAAVNTFVGEEKEAAKAVEFLEKELATFLQTTEVAVETAVEKAVVEVEKDLKLAK
jgi:violaxanthin de-epoxidase